MSEIHRDRHAASLGEVARAASALLRALLRRPSARRAGDDTLVLSGGRNDGPPDLDELWRDFNRKLSGMFGGKGGGQRPSRSNGDRPPDSGPPFQPNMKSAGIGVGLIAGVVALVWLGSGVFIVQEGQQAVVTSFGRYAYTVDAGIQWRFPYPFQAHETVPVTQLRSVEMGRNTPVPATGLRDSSMLTQDENIIDIRFTVQYRLKDARAFLFENRNPDEAVVQASESAVREIVGRSNVDAVLYERARPAGRGPAGVGAGAARPAEHRHPGGQRQRAEGGGARPGAGGLQRRGQGHGRPRPLQERRPGLRQRRDPAGAGHGRAPARGGRRLPRARGVDGRR